MTDRELKAAAIGIITYVQMCQTGKPPQLDMEEQIIESAAYLDNATFDKALEICSYANLDDVELFEETDAE